MSIRKSTESYVHQLAWHMMPVDGGQIVEVMYSCDEDGVWCRQHDRSDHTTTYQFAPYSARATESQLEFAPQNHRLPRHNGWQKVKLV